MSTTDSTLPAKSDPLFLKYCQDRADGKVGAPRLPEHPDQLHHILRKGDGHLEDTPVNRKRLTDLAADPEKFIGTDRFGNFWHAEILEDGTQLWVKYRSNGVINDGGLNQIPRNCDKEHGLNNFNPFSRR